MDSQEVIKKRNKIFISFMIVVGVFLTAMILIAIFVQNRDNMTLINVILAVVLMIISVSYKNILFGYNNMAKIAKVILSQAKPITYRKNIIENPEIVLNKGFKVHANNKLYSILYKIDSDNALKVKRIKILSLVLILKSDKLDFYDKNLHDDIGKLEKSFTRKEFPSKYVITAFKSFDKMDDKSLKEIGEVVTYKDRRQSYTQVNVGLSKEDNKAYFLYSETSYPSIYYKIAVDFIKDIIK